MFTVAIIVGSVLFGGVIGIVSFMHGAEKHLRLESERRYLEEREARTTRDPVTGLRVFHTYADGSPAEGALPEDTW
jgi:hypothetical protein